MAPANRYQSAREFREDLESFLSQERIPTAVKGSALRAAVRHARLKVRRHPLGFAIAAVVAASAVVYSVIPNEELGADTFFARSESEIRENLKRSRRLSIGSSRSSN